MARNPERSGYTPTEDTHLITKSYLETALAALQSQVTSLSGQIVALGGGGIPDPGLSPAYINADGQGDRQATVIATSTLGLFPPGPGDIAPRLVNGNFTFENFFQAIADLSTHWIAFDFGEPVLITEARWFQSTSGGATVCGTWQWQGSNNGSTWSDIGSTFGLDTANNVALGRPADGQVLSTLSGNAFVWRYYRMKGVSGSFAASSYVFEIEFKIDR